MLTHRRSRLFAVGALAGLILFTTSAARRSVVIAGPILSATPNPLKFSPTPVGTFSFEVVTITNSGDAADYITLGFPSQGTFWATDGGTCNTSVDANGNNYYIPPGFSCTFQWGFAPTAPGKQTGTGTIYFLSGATIEMTFSGVGTHHP